MKPFDAPQPTLTAQTPSGEKITLRVPVLRDAAALVVACSDPEALRWTTIKPGYDQERALGFINDYAPGWWLREQGGCWVIADAEDAYAGQIDLRFLDGHPGVADIGFLTAPHARGRGYMTAALRAVAEFGITELGLKRVEWKAHVGNVGSRLVAERAGFTFEGTLRNALIHHDEHIDAWIASLIPGDLR